MKGKVIIFRGERSLVSRIFGSILLGLSLTVFFLYFKNLFYSVSTGYFGNIYTTLQIFLPIFIVGCSLSYTVSHEFDFYKKKYRELYNIGPLSFGSWEKFDNLKHVSTFLNSRGYCEVNILDVNNKRYNTLAFKEIEGAVKYGRELAETLNIKFKERK